jgi:hypothetical protein
MFQLESSPLGVNIVCDAGFGVASQASGPDQVNVFFFSCPEG